jgi:hypothetical protein
MEEPFGKLCFDAEDAAAALAAGAQPAELVRERHAEIVAAMGRTGYRSTWAFDPAHPWATTWPFLESIDDVRAYHAGIAIPDDVSWASLRDLGRHVRLDRKLHGSPGLRASWWLMLHFRGLLFEVGRLQFEVLSDDELGIHVPATGPLDPTACDDSIRRVRELLGPRTMICESWLLDPALAEYLPAESNILRFQRRFERLTEGDVDDRVVELVFALRAPVDELPQRTTLERAVVAHLRSGRRFVAPIGRLAL